MATIISHETKKYSFRENDSASYNRTVRSNTIKLEDIWILKLKPFHLEDLNQEFRKRCSGCQTSCLLNFLHTIVIIHGIIQTQSILNSLKSPSMVTYYIKYNSKLYSKFSVIQHIGRHLYP